jgi:bacterioferritin-associated ferredoxin
MGQGIWHAGAVMVCQCEAVNDRRIVAEIEAGAGCPEDVAAACGAGARCGGCRPTILALLASLGRVEQPVAVSA